MIRRQFIDLVALSAALAAVGAGTSGCDAPKPDQTPEPKGPSPLMQQVAMLVYPGFTALDMVGPQLAFSTLENVQVHLVWKTLDPVTSDTGITVQPTMTIADCPDKLQIVFVPGGTKGTVALMSDDVVLDFLATRGATADYVTSVCTGSLVLGAAGLLRGYKATSHWSAREVLALLEAEPVEARYVEDQNRITGAGVTSGIDFGLRIVSKLRGEMYAQAVQLNIEYAPEPPFNAGSPATAPAAVVEMLLNIGAPFLAAAKEAAVKAQAKFSG